MYFTKRNFTVLYNSYSRDNISGYNLILMFTVKLLLMCSSYMNFFFE